MKSGFLENVDNSFIYSHWIITRACNYACSYCCCPELTAMPNTPNADKETIGNTIAALNYMNTTKPVRLVITGGEPTLKNLQSILSKLQLEEPVAIFTNLFRPVEYFLDLNNIHPIRILATFHRSEIDAEPFSRKVREISKKIDIVVKTDSSSLLDLEGIPVEYFNFYGTGIKNTSSTYNKYKAYFLGDDAVSLPEIMFSNFNGWKCSAPKSGICIDYDGLVYACKRHFQANQCLPFTVSKQFKAGFDALPDSMLCPFDSCTSDLEILKERL